MPRRGGGGGGGAVRFAATSEDVESLLDGPVDGVPYKYDDAEGRLL